MELDGKTMLSKERSLGMASVGGTLMISKSIPAIMYNR